MSYLLTEDAKALRESAGKFFAGSDSLKNLRQWRDTKDLTEAARGAWEGMVELGFAGILIPEEFGGVGLDSRASIQIAEMMGKTLSGGPFISSAVMAATAISHGDNDRLKAELLPAIAGGMIVAIACEEKPRHSPHGIGTVAMKRGENYVLSGRKTAIIDGNIADRLIVAARPLDGHDLMLFLVDTDASGITIKSGMGIDSHPLVEIEFHDVQAATSNLICDPRHAPHLLDRAYDAGRLHLAAEMLGAAQEAFDRAVEYLKTRVQFGKKIGEFQALQHRAAILFGELEIARSTVLKAATGSAEHISMAKARVGEIAKKVAGEAVQFHGGIGVTDDFDLGFFLKRIRVAAEQLGDSAFHTERYAMIQGL